jgi:uncharacterized protein
MRGVNPIVSSVEATKKGYECFSEGRHFVSNTDLLDDNCIWISPGPSDRLPWAGTFKGKHEIANFFAQVGANLEFSEFAPREVIEHGETVLVLGTLAGQAKKTGKAVKNEWAHVFYIPARKGRFFQEYIDTAAVVLAQRKPVAPLNKKVSGQSWVLLAQG